MTFARRHAFTLVELLATLSLIAILAALTIAAVGRVRSAARSSLCLTNLRQWGIALHLYATDHQRDLPRRGQGVQQVFRIDRPEDWFNALPAYAGGRPYQQMAVNGTRIRADDGSLFACPDAEDDTTAAHFLPYAMNMYLSPWIRPQPHRLNEIDGWNTLVFLADGPGAWSSALPSAQPFSIVARHRGRTHLCFLDGHVAAIDGKTAGCGAVDPHRADVRWETGTDGVNQAPLP